MNDHDKKIFKELVSLPPSRRELIIKPFLDQSVEYSFLEKPLFDEKYLMFGKDSDEESVDLIPYRHQHAFTLHGKRNHISSDSDSGNQNDHEEDQNSGSIENESGKYTRVRTSRGMKRLPKALKPNDSSEDNDTDLWDFPQYKSEGEDNCDCEEEEMTFEKGCSREAHPKMNANSYKHLEYKADWREAKETIETSENSNRGDKILNTKNPSNDQTPSFIRRYASRHCKKKLKLKRSTQGMSNTFGSPNNQVIKAESQSSESFESRLVKNNSEPVNQHPMLKGGRKNILRSRGVDELTVSTQEVNKKENERTIRAMKIQELLQNCPAAQNKERLILDIDHKTNEPRVEVHCELVKHLKNHQREGIQFMYTNTIENIELLEGDSEGGGCLLAHCMGLGKTLQVIAFVHTVLNHQLLKEKLGRIMIAAPVNTLKNWYDEFLKWLPDSLDIYQMADQKKYSNRIKTISNWHKYGGVLIIGLQASTLSSNIKLETMTNSDSEKLPIDPDPNILIIDEGHTLKNSESNSFQAFSRMKTKRKIILTGTPLQNNLVEYYTMISLIKPRLLGSKKEFANRFKNPIENGQHADSTALDVMKMKSAISVLNVLLSGCVQRFDRDILKPYLEPKFEYSIFVQATDLIITLYNYYLDSVTGPKNRRLSDDSVKLRLICNHPAILPAKIEKEAQYAAWIEREKRTPSTSSLDEPLDRHSAKEKSSEWFFKFMKDGTSFKEVHLSSKFVIFFFILDRCIIMKEKLVVISQCLETLDLIEEFLASPMKIRDFSSQSRELKWIQERNYFRIDGLVRFDKRKYYIDSFNNPENKEARLFLLAVKAGGLGVNLIGANRAIIFDTHWNPTVDMQAIFRIYRLGQTKPTYIYRLITKDTIEEKVYFKQILKTGLSMRVVDKTNIQNSVKKADVEEYYSIRPNKCSESRLLPSLPKDDLLSDLISLYKDCIVDYREQDSLLQKRPEEDLDEKERQKAWEDFKRERDLERNRMEMTEQTSLTEHEYSDSELSEKSQSISVSTYNPDPMDEIDVLKDRSSHGYNSEDGTSDVSKELDPLTSENDSSDEESEKNSERSCSKNKINRVLKEFKRLSGGINRNRETKESSQSSESDTPESVMSDVSKHLEPFTTDVDSSDDQSSKTQFVKKKTSKFRAKFWSEVIVLSSSDDD